MIFWKYHGIGNDFIVLTGLAEDLEIDNIINKKINNRKYRIRAESVL